VLFWRDDESTVGALLAPRSAFQAVVVILVGVLPAFSAHDLWDSYLSFALYSGNTHQAVIYVSRPVVDQLPASIRPHIWQRTEPFFLDINRWAYGELNVPVYPEPRVFRRVAELVCAYRDGPADVRLLIKKKPNPLTGLRESEAYPCDRLP
jgi:hypothetical protein